jgi:hypothetical protein
LQLGARMLAHFDERVGGKLTHSGLS